MYKLGKYRETDRMSELISENYPMLLVMSRFGINLGFGDKNIREVCEGNNVDVKTFLTVVNMLAEEHLVIEDMDASLSIEALVSYLQNSHKYFLDFRLPAIRSKLNQAIGSGKSDVSIVIMRYYDQYVNEVRKHMMYEEEVVFPYVRSLLDGRRDDKYNIDVFRSKHDHIEARLSELKNILIKYYPAQSSNELNSVLFDIFSTEKDLASHNHVEDNLFVPAIEELESQGRECR